MFENVSIEGLFFPDAKIGKIIARCVFCEAKQVPLPHGRESIEKFEDR
jgi:hypothetical protein